MRRVELSAPPVEVQTSLASGRMDAYKDPSVLAWLRSVFHGKCAYCEQAVHIGEREHYTAKGTHPALRNDWKNLRLSCRDCNHHKTLMQSRTQSPESEDATLLDPCDENFEPAEHLRASAYDHTPYQVVRLEPQTRLAYQTVERKGLHLNREVLLRERYLH